MRLPGALLVLSLLSPLVHAAEPTELTMATLAPKGSSWAKILDKGAQELALRTQGRVKFKYYFGGQLGDERDVVRQMKLGSLSGAAVTSVGLGLIKGDVRVLQLPFLFRNDKELDYVRGKMAHEFEKQFDEAGYVLMAWGDVGWVHLYTNSVVNTRDDLSKVKMWAWTDDPIIRTLFKRVGVNGVPLGVPDVLPNLQTGLINGCYGPPLVAIAFQWYTKVKFATTMALSYSIGALVLKKDLFSKLSPDDQKAVREVGKIIDADLIRVIRKDNERARGAMEKAGIKFVPIPDPLLNEFETAARAAWDELAGKVYSKDLLEKIKKYVAEARK